MSTFRYKRRQPYNFKIARACQTNATIARVPEIDNKLNAMTKDSRWSLRYCTGPVFTEITRASLSVKEEIVVILVKVASLVVVDRQAPCIYRGVLLCGYARYLSRRTIWALGRKQIK